MIELQVGSQTIEVDSYQFVTELYSATYENRWADIGCLAAFIGGLQVRLHCCAIAACSLLVRCVLWLTLLRARSACSQMCHLYATRFKQHIDR
jgi:hypothetical protein